ncbi:MAG: choice-of-anchor D domain-containing protein [Planctomycetes bacterium]|nr:choice-of-anchor D domain-containing protein [Planctomycetota bacterium]MCW8135584.1 choice-of-anchor D domain-containing protein [Planctomycetota bacterium]
MRSMLLLIVLTAGASLSAQSYTVSAGSHTYADLSTMTALSLGYGGTSGVISPTGFSFNYFGTNYSSFQVYASGYIVMGSATGTPTKAVNHASGVGNFVSPLWGDYNPQAWLGWASTWGEVGYRFSAGVLVVEWKNIPSNGNNMVGVRMQAVLDTANGTIEFRYGAPQGGSGYTNSSNYACAISNPNTSSPQQVVAGSDGSYVSSNGAVNTYPAGRYIRFTPLTPQPMNIPPVVTVAYDPGTGSTLLVNNSTINVAYGTSVASLAFVVAVNDSDNDDCSLSASISNIGATGLDTQEWTKASAPVPYQLQPGSGTFNTAGGVTHNFTLTANDGTDNTVFNFTVVQAAAPAPVLEVAAGGTAVSSGQAAAGTNRDFGSVDVGSSSGALTITLSNTGGSDLTVNTPSVGGASTEFVIDTSSMSGTVSAGNSTSFTITFAPTSAGPKQAQLALANNAGADFILHVAGTGANPPVPAPVLVVRLGGAAGPLITNGGGIDFGAVTIGGNAQRTIFVQNSGNANLTPGAPQSSGAEYTAGTLPGTIAQGASATFTITYAPTAAGTHNRTVTFTHNDGTTATPFVINVQGTAAGTGGPGGGGGGCVAGHGGFAMVLLMLVAVMGVRSRRHRRASGQ